MFETWFRVWLQDSVLPFSWPISGASLFFGTRQPFLQSIPFLNNQCEWKISSSTWILPQISAPSLRSFSAVAGFIAIRLSPGWISFRITIFIKEPHKFKLMEFYNLRTIIRAALSAIISFVSIIVYISTLMEYTSGLAWVHLFLMLAQLLITAIFACVFYYNYNKMLEKDKKS